MIDLFVGIAGGVLILGAFALDEMGVWSRKELSYNVVNAFGALFLL
jgi:hypothetical protein